MRQAAAGAKIGHLGEWLIDAAPVVMKGLAIVGTLAMFLVGGGIFSHNIPPIEHLFKAWAALTLSLSIRSRLLVLDGLIGVVIGHHYRGDPFASAPGSQGWGEDSKAEHTAQTSHPGTLREIVVKLQHGRPFSDTHT